MLAWYAYKWSDAMQVPVAIFPLKSALDTWLADERARGATYHVERKAVTLPDLHPNHALSVTEGEQ